jgi:hypothetical protein
MTTTLDTCQQGEGFCMHVFSYKKLNTCRDVLGLLKRTTIEQRLVGPRPSDGWIKIGPGGGITGQTWNISVDN